MVFIPPSHNRFAVLSEGLSRCLWAHGQNLRTGSDSFGQEPPEGMVQDAVWSAEQGPQQQRGADQHADGHVPIVERGFAMLAGGVKSHAASIVRCDVTSTRSPCRSTG